MYYNKNYHLPCQQVATQSQAIMIIFVSTKIISQNLMNIVTMTTQEVELQSIFIKVLFCKLYTGNFSYTIKLIKAF